MAGDVSLEMSGTCQSYIDPASDKVKITGRVSGVVTNSYTQARSPRREGKSWKGQQGRQFNQFAEPALPEPHPRLTVFAFLCGPARIRRLQGQCSVVAGNPVTTRPCNKVARLPSPPATPRWTCGVILMEPTDPGCSWTSGNRRRVC